MQAQVAATELSDRITTTALIIYSKHCQNNAEVNAVELCASKYIIYTYIYIYIHMCV